MAYGTVAQLAAHLRDMGGQGVQSLSAPLLFANPEDLELGTSLIGAVIADNVSPPD